MNVFKAIGSAADSMGSALPIVGGLVSGVSDAIQSRRNQDRQNKQNRELAEYQYSKDLQMWSIQNKYNNPAAQMERLKQAGLNPNLVYGTGTVTGNTASQLPKYNAPNMEYNATPVLGNAMQTIGAYQDFKLGNAQLDNLKKQRDILESEDRIKAAEADAATKYFSGRGNTTWSKGNEGLQRWGWLEKWDEKKAQSQGLNMLDYQQEGKEADIANKWKRIEAMKADIAYKNKLTEWMDAEKISKVFGQFAGPAMGILKGMMGKFGGAGSKGISGKFPVKSPSYGNHLKVDRWTGEILN